METDNFEEDIQRYTHIYNNTDHTNFKRTPQEAFDNFQDYELGKCNIQNRKMKERPKKLKCEFKI